MAGGLGFLLGAGVGAAAGEIRQKRQDQHRHDDALFDFYSKNPQLVADSPDAQKFVNKYAGSEASQAFIGMAQHTKAAAQQFGQITGGGGAAPTAGGGAAAGGGPRLPQTPAEIEDEQRKLVAFQGSPDGRLYEQSNPGVIKNWMEILDKHAARLQRDQEFQQRQKETEVAHADTQQQREIANQMRQESINLQAQNAGFMHQLAMESEDLKKQTIFGNASKNLASQTETIAKMLSSATPADPATVKTLLDARNAQARQLKAQAEKSGIDYDPEEFKPLTTKQVPGWLASHTRGLVGGSSTQITEATPKTEEARPAGVGADWTQGTVKGRAAWISPDKKSAVFL